MDKKKVVIGMSGGVDSSVAAYLLKEQGYEVIGVNMDVWQGEQEDARTVADSLGIKYAVYDYKKQFKREVVDYFVEEYMAGRTPNPCNMCNRRIKWDCLLNAAKDFGAEYIATGHYARIDKLSNGRYAICNSVTATKDQTYALCNLTQEQLAHTLMPIGEYEKDKVREIAKEIGIHIADKADSQDICFIPDGDYAAFISENIDKDIESGDFVDKTGKKLGTHKGIIHYTIGQRKGLNLPMGHPVFVTDINVRDNQVVIGESEDLFTTRVVASQFNYMAVEKMEPGEEYIGKIRYAHKGTKCKVVKTWEDKVKIEFDEPVRAVTPGQNLVLYMGEYVAGGGVIIRG